MKVGITGHQRFGDPHTAKWVRQALHDVMVQLRTSEGITSLAAGTDQLFALILIDLGIPFMFVQPCSDYRSTFGDTEGLKAFESLARQARSTLTLPFATPSEEAFFAAGKKVVELATCVVAVWDGRPARGLGGTADVVKYARDCGRQVRHIDPTTRSVSDLIGGPP